MARRALSALLFALLLLGAGLALTGTAAAATCPTGWGSLPKDNPTMGTGEVDNLRTGTHDCYDRLVIEVDGPAGGWHAAYVDQVTADASGAVVTTPGNGKKLQLTVRHPWYSAPAPGTPVASVAGFPTFRSVVAAGSFEGQTTFGIGLRNGPLPYRVFTLAGPGGHSRIVVDVRHTW